jgi:DNA-binding transcriptional MerR regulator
MLAQTIKPKNKKSTFSNSKELPLIPDKIYFSIGEVSRLCKVEPHVLRYWELEFYQLRPSRRRGNRRYYQRKDVILIRQLRSLLYDQGYTIDGAKVQISPYHNNSNSSSSTGQKTKTILKDITSTIEQIMTDLDTDTENC